MADKTKKDTSKAAPYDLTDAEKADQGGEAFVIQEDPSIFAAPDETIIPPAVADQVPTEVAPEEGLVGQVPVMTPGVMAPVSSRALPNAHFDAVALAQENGVFDQDAPLPSPAEDRGQGPRGAYELAKLLERRPEWVNELDKLDALERADGVENPRPWAGDPVDLYEQAKRYNFYFIAANGNQIPGGVGRQR